MPYAFAGHAPTEGVHDSGFLAFWMLRLGYTILPIVAGLDKFVDWLAQWSIYLWSGINSAVPGDAQDVMYVVGAVEIAAGLLVFFAPRLGGTVVALWLAGIVFNLIAASIDDAFEFWDIALRDFGLMLGALALVVLSAKYGPKAKSKLAPDAPTPRRTRTRTKA